MICHSRVGICILQKFWEVWVLLLLDLGTEDGPSVRTKLRSTLTTVVFLQANLELGVRVLMDVHGLRGCGIVDGFSEKSGCLRFPVLSHKYLCLKRSYPGGAVHFAFTRSVIPVVVVVIYAGTAVYCLHHLWGVV